MRRVQPDGSGDIIWALTHILFGTSTALLVSQSCYAESNTYLTLTQGLTKAMDVVY